MWGQVVWNKNYRVACYTWNEYTGPSLVREYSLYAYETETGHGQRQISFKDNNFILTCRQITDCTPTQSMQIMDNRFAG